MEQWLPVVGWEDLYEVSDLGNVRSLRRSKILRTTINAADYPIIGLCKNGKQKTAYVHHLVLEAFIGPRPPGLEARHLDRIPQNAALRDEDGKQRLIWGTSSENKFDEVAHGTHSESSRDRCDNGHEFTEANTNIRRYPDGTFRQRECRECGRLRSAARRELRAKDQRRCKEDGCDNPYFGRDWCSSHYDQWYRQQPGVLERAAARQRRYQERKGVK